MNQSTFSIPANTRIAYIEAGWHSDIVTNARHAFEEGMRKHGLPSDAVDVVSVPGSLEIPLQCQRLSRSGRYQIVVACGLIVDGGIYRHDFVASTVLDAMMQVQLESNVPILSVVLTPHHFSTAKAHVDFFREHFTVKGEEAAEACVQTLQNTLCSTDPAQAA